VFLELIPAGPALVCRDRCTPSDLQQLFPARRHLADRDCARPSPPRAWGRIGAAALGLPAGAAKGSERIAEIQVEIHSRGRGLVLLRRPVATDARRRRPRLYAAHHRAWVRRRAHPPSADGRTGPLRLALPARAHPSRSRNCCARFPPAASTSSRSDEQAVGSLSGLCRVGMGHPRVIHRKGATINTAYRP
jgi:hypothetical protein